MPSTGRRNPLDLTPRRPTAGERGLALRQRDRGRQARAPDQLVLPQPRRGDVRGVPAADGGHRVQELPDHRARGSRGREGQVPLPPLRGAFPGDPAPEHAPLSHLELVERADALLIAPASANTVAKLATGHADNLLTAAALACRRPLIVAPAMNGAMYEHPATQENLARLRERSVRVLDPGTGSLASLGEYGTGRLPEPTELLAAFEAALRAGRELDGLNVLVTAGGTREPIDAVRFVGNRSSGRMGFALAEEAARRGADG